MKMSEDPLYIGKLVGLCTWSFLPRDSLLVLL